MSKNVSVTQDNTHKKSGTIGNSMKGDNSMKTRPSKATVIRTAILVLAIINNALALANKSPLPIDNETVTEVISFGFTTAAAIAAWWKNNSFTQKAIEADKTFKLK